ncbi:hypothetical protein LSTR_LSTR009512 [Laodelphax striatellus]|uniref:Regulatory protein zeste n=1 Tax=Laodelphax striatellus TaxID=195883 RepID=A0A482WDU0_LAOST|nr:hypothetical protein LSTR_LSTR009512 [Laodelphax striatellus]
MDRRRLFTSKEKEFLKQLVLQYSDVIEEKRSDGPNNKKKNEAWTQIQQDFNSIGDQSQKKYRGQKKRKQGDMVRDELHEKVKSARTLNEQQKTIHQLMK